MTKRREQRHLPTEKVRSLRKAETPAEAELWEHLRDNKLGVKFRRQQPIKDTSYVVDFCCLPIKLIIELDGGIHITQHALDITRQSETETLGFRFCAFQMNKFSSTFIKF
jgi:very-short-patch-repair endonuclease